MYYTAWVMFVFGALVALTALFFVLVEIFSAPVDPEKRTPTDGVLVVAYLTLAFVGAGIAAIGADAGELFK